MAVLLYFIYSYVVLVQYFQKKKKKNLRTFNNEFPLFVSLINDIDDPCDSLEYPSLL